MTVSTNIGLQLTDARCWFTIQKYLELSRAYEVRPRVIFIITCILLCDYSIILLYLLDFRTSELMYSLMSSTLNKYIFMAVTPILGRVHSIRPCFQFKKMKKRRYFLNFLFLSYVMGCDLNWRRTTSLQRRLPFQHGLHASLFKTHLRGCSFKGHINVLFAYKLISFFVRCGRLYDHFVFLDYKIDITKFWYKGIMDIK